MRLISSQPHEELRHQRNSRRQRCLLSVTGLFFIAIVQRIAFMSFRASSSRGRNIEILCHAFTPGFRHSPGLCAWENRTFGRSQADLSLFQF